MSLPAGMAINELQTDPDFKAMRRQDPDAPLKQLATPLSKPVGKQGAAPAAPASGALYGHGVANAADAGEPKDFSLSEEDRAGLLAAGVPERLLPAMADLKITPAMVVRLRRQGITPEQIAELAEADVATRASEWELRVVAVRDGVATLRSWMRDWDVREGERVHTIGRVSRITPAGQVWLDGMGDPLPMVR